MLSFTNWGTVGDTNGCPRGMCFNNTIFALKLKKICNTRAKPGSILLLPIFWIYAKQLILELVFSLRKHRFNKKKHILEVRVHILVKVQ